MELNAAETTHSRLAELGRGFRGNSKTHHYKKVTKPLIERHRRSRINGSLEDLRRLLLETNDAPHASVMRMEKADVLKLTVRKLEALLRSESAEMSVRERIDVFRSGFAACVQKVETLALHGAPQSNGVDRSFLLDYLKLCYEQTTSEHGEKSLVHSRSSCTSPQSPATISRGILRPVKVIYNEIGATEGKSSNAAGVWRPW